MASSVVADSFVPSDVLESDDSGSDMNPLSAHAPTTPIKAPTSSSLFPKLPVELRLNIWRYASFEQRNVDIVSWTHFWRSLPCWVPRQVISSRVPPRHPEKGCFTLFPHNTLHWQILTISLSSGLAGWNSEAGDHAPKTPTTSTPLVPILSFYTFPGKPGLKQNNITPCVLDR